jgi:hypothetical protein
VPPRSSASLNETLDPFERLDHNRIHPIRDSMTARQHCLDELFIPLVKAE